MTQRHTGNVTPETHNEEHDNYGGIATKKVLVYGFDGTSKQILKVDTNGNVMNGGRLVTASFDYVAATYPNATTEVYTYKTGGSGGTTVATITVVYTTSTKDVLTSVTKT